MLYGVSFFAISYADMRLYVLIGASLLVFFSLDFAEAALLVLFVLDFAVAVLLVVALGFVVVLAAVALELLELAAAPELLTAFSEVSEGTAGLELLPELLELFVEFTAYELLFKPNRLELFEPLEAVAADKSKSNPPDAIVVFVGTV